MSVVRHALGSLGQLIDRSLPRGSHHAGGTSPPRALRRRAPACTHERNARLAERVLAPPVCLECQSDDGALAAALRAGDERAFGLLVDRETAAVYRTCYRILGSRDEAAETTKVTFAAAHRALGTFSYSGRPGAWLAAIATREAWRYWNTRSTWGAAAMPDSWKAQPRPDEDDPERPEMDAQERAQVRHAVSVLPDANREVVTLWFFGGLSLDEIGAMTRRPADVVRAQLVTGLEQMRESGDEAAP
jgi:RNA polymerase sigma-70 factor (ECF subfamily)